MAGPLLPGERRSAPRCPVDGRAVAFFGRCTCAILDVSAVGLALRCAVLEPEQGAADHLDIFLADTGFYLPQVPIRLVAETAVFPRIMFSSLRVRRLGLRFGPLSAEQQRRLGEFIDLCRTVGQ